MYLCLALTNESKYDKYHYNRGQAQCLKCAEQMLITSQISYTGLRLSARFSTEEDLIEKLTHFLTRQVTKNVILQRLLRILSRANRTRRRTSLSPVNMTNLARPFPRKPGTPIYLKEWLERSRPRPYSIMSIFIPCSRVSLPH